MNVADGTKIKGADRDNIFVLLKPSFKSKKKINGIKYNPRWEGSLNRNVFLLCHKSRLNKLMSAIDSKITNEQVVTTKNLMSDLYLKI